MPLKALVETQAHKPFSWLQQCVGCYFREQAEDRGNARDRGDEHRVVHCGHEYERFIVSKSKTYFEAQPHEMLQTYIAGVFKEADGANIALDEGWVKIGETDDMPAYFKSR